MDGGAHQWPEGVGGFIKFTLLSPAEGPGLPGVRGHISTLGGERWVAAHVRWESQVPCTQVTAGLQSQAEQALARSR